MKILLPARDRGAALRRRGGFTLFETVLALLIFSIAVVSLVEVINKMGLASSEARRMRTVQSQLETILRETTRHPPQEILSGQTSYQTHATNAGVDYLTRIQKVELSNVDNQPLPGIYSVSVSATWTDGGAKEQLTADTLLYPPLYYAPR